MTPGSHAPDPLSSSDLRLPTSLRRVLVVVVGALVAATLVGVVLLWPPASATRLGQGQLGTPVDLVNATVVAAPIVPCRSALPGVALTCRDVTARLDSGPEKGQTSSLDITEGPDQPTLREGDRVVLGRAADPGSEVAYYFSDYQRRTPLLALGLLFALAVVGSSLIAVVIIYLAHGVNARTTTAVLGTLVSLGLTALLAVVFVELTRLTGLSSEEGTYLRGLLGGRVNLKGLLLGGIVIGALGVLNDVTVTQASAVWEIYLANPATGVRQLYRSAMRIGRDHIASTVDTLVLAYAGAALPLLVIFTVAGRRLGDVLTGEIVAEEVVQTLIGSLGLVAAVPVTTGLACLLVTRMVRRRRPD